MGPDGWKRDLETTGDAGYEKEGVINAKATVYQLCFFSVIFPKIVESRLKLGDGTYPWRVQLKTMGSLATSGHCSHIATVSVPSSGCPLCKGGGHLWPHSPTRVGATHSGAVTAHADMCWHLWLLI